MDKAANFHQPVLLNECLEGLAIKPEGIYIDATFGRAGHSRSILARLNSHGILIIIDKDPEAIHYAQHLFHNDPRVAIVQNSFAALYDIAKEKQVLGKANGILLDLGLSSPQLDTASRGFSFMRDGPLDMRMDPTQEMDAATWINHAPIGEIAEVLHEYGEERFFKRIAQEIVKARARAPITTTVQLANIIKHANPIWEKHKHPATRSFQAIRIFINHELQDLTQALTAAYDVLAPEGRLLVISFHSLEDRIVKRFFRHQQQDSHLPKKLPIATPKILPTMKRIGKVIKPNRSEINLNPRSRSAVLRIGEKIR